eukprot:scaffold123275_cov28-Tisochrysis_lutea.AAC.1
MALRNPAVGLLSVHIDTPGRLSSNYCGARERGNAAHDGNDGSGEGTGADTAGESRRRHHDPVGRELWIDGEAGVQRAQFLTGEMEGTVSPASYGLVGVRLLVPSPVLASLTRPDFRGMNATCSCSGFSHPRRKLRSTRPTP